MNKLRKAIRTGTEEEICSVFDALADNEWDGLGLVECEEEIAEAIVAARDKPEDFVLGIVDGENRGRSKIVIRCDARRLTVGDRVTITKAK